MLELDPASVSVLARLGAPACLAWYLCCVDGAVLLVDRRQTCYFQGLDAAPAASGAASLALVGGELHLRMPYACLRFDRRVRML